MGNMFIYNFEICNHNQYKLVIAEADNRICNVLFYSKNRTLRAAFCEDNFINSETQLLKEASKQLDEYFNKKRKIFDLPLLPHGTDFQKKVWKALQTIPYGETCSYGKLAEITGNPKASRAVGNANNRNPIHIIIPCHRVIGHNGSLTGYAAGVEVKQKLLEIESAAL